ncbi:CheR family methyltransferase [Longibacter sp.]|uniref:CheR family methyltransferase n=1 Tax=Longibacter sp. TaxID=2045415 RepID=UPI003EBBE347
MTDSTTIVTPGLTQSEGNATRSEDSETGTNDSPVHDGEQEYWGTYRQGKRGASVSDGSDVVPVVGIGASAGGVGALRQLFAHLRPSTGMAYVVILHLSPDVKSNLVEILRQVTDLPVETVESGKTVEADHVYVIPPGRRLEIQNHVLYLHDVEDPHAPTTIDRFFRSLARDLNEHAIGVVLSGTGADGTIGFKSIREYGGVTMVQAPQDAEYDGMPQSALSTGLVDVVGTASEIADSLRTYGDNLDQIQLERGRAEEKIGDSSSDLDTIFRLLYSATHHDFSNYKWSMVLRRVERRMQLSGIESLEGYISRLEQDEDEILSLRRDLLISVTSFFRDPDSFERLEKDVIPELFGDKKAGESVRVWVTGCATGEEAYSLAILLREVADRHDSAPDIQIFATDVDASALDVARAGVYPFSIQSEVGEERLKQFFESEGGQYRVRPKLREMILFAEHNVLEDPPFSNLDLVSCRNLLIYLNQKMQQHLLRLLHYGLRPGGYLFLGRSEAAGRTSDFFTVVDKSTNIFKSRSLPDDRPRRIPLFSGRWSRFGGMSTLDQRSNIGHAFAHKEAIDRDTVDRLHRDLVMRQVASVLVNENYEILHLSDGAGRFLKLSGGTPSLKILACVPDEIRVELRGALYETFKHGKRETDFTIQSINDDASTEIEVVVRLVEPPRVGETGRESPVAWIRFDRFLIDPSDRAEPSSLEAELNRALMQTREQLQNTSEEYEATAEEMEAANEELLSMNEELQSKNEELQTSKEELQSVNEELKTTNQALKLRVDEVKEVNTALETLMDATDIAMIFLDKQLRIMRFTPRATELFSIRPVDIGRPLSDFSQRFEYADLMDDVQEIVKTGTSVERELHQGEDRWMLVRCGPYETEEGSIDGVVLTFVDVTEQRRLERAVVNASEREQRRIGQDLHDLLASRLTGASMMLQNLRTLASSPDRSISEEKVTQIIDIIQEAANETRNLSHALVPVALQESHLSVALRILANEMDKRHKVRFRFEGSEEETAPEDDLASMHLYRIAYEAVNNALQHAKCENVTVALRREGGRLVLEVSDDGVGIPADVNKSSDSMGDRDVGLGLKSMKRRATLIGASFSINGAPGQGTTIRCELPFE